MSGFWEKQLGVPQQAPPHIVQPASPSAPGSWWQTPASVPVQASTPQRPHYDPGSGVIPQYSRSELTSMRVEHMDQGMMEALAQYELMDDKYNQACPNCQSPDFIPAGTKIGSTRMPNDKCFHCGSQGALTGSPEPAAGGGTGKPGRQTRQTQAGGQGSYGQHISQIPQQYMPRGGA